MALAGTGAFAEILDGEVYKYYAEGEWRASGSGKSVPIVNPTTRKTQYRVQGAGSRLCLCSPPLFSSHASSGSKNLGELVLVLCCCPLVCGKRRLMGTQTCYRRIPSMFTKLTWPRGVINGCLHYHFP